MKLDLILGSTLVLTVGVCFGAWLGMDTIVVEVETIPTKTRLDQVSIFASLLGGVAGMAATALAIKVYAQWNRQQREEVIIKTKFEVIKSLSDLDVQFARIILVCDSVNEEALATELSKLHVCNLTVMNQIRLLYTIDSNLRGNREIATCRANSLGDFLDQTKLVVNIASDLNSHLKKQLLTIANDDVVLSDQRFIKPDVKRVFDNVFEKDMRSSRMPLYLEISNKTQEAMEAVNNTV